MTKAVKLADRWRSALRVEGIIGAAMETVNEEFLLGSLAKDDYEKMVRNLSLALSISRTHADNMREEYLKMLVPYGR